MIRSSLLFGEARCHAAEHSSYSVLAAMINLHYEDDFQNLRLYFLRRAAEFGCVEATQFVFGFQATQRPWAFSRKRTRPSYPFHNEQGLARLHTPSREIFDFFMEKRRAYCTTRAYGAKEYTAFPVHSAQNGWVDMTTHYLSLGASVEGLGLSTDDAEQRPLIGACRYGHEEVVRVLLAHGAETCQPALETAVRYGQLGIVSVLLDHGAEIGGAIAEAVAKGYRIIVHAVLRHDNKANSGLQDLLVRAVDCPESRVLADLKSKTTSLCKLFQSGYYTRVHVS